jgi:hypothetical protein
LPCVRVLVFLVYWSFMFSVNTIAMCLIKEDLLKFKSLQSKALNKR